MPSMILSFSGSAISFLLSRGFPGEALPPCAESAAAFLGKSCQFFGKALPLFFPSSAGRCRGRGAGRRGVFPPSGAGRKTFLKKNCAKILLISEKVPIFAAQNQKGVLAHLARARHWQCRGERFESAILHRVAHMLRKTVRRLPQFFFVFPTQAGCIRERNRAFVSLVCTIFAPKPFRS